MNKFLTLVALYSVIQISAHSQMINRLSEMSYYSGNKGTILLKDGSLMSFQKIMINGDTIIYEDQFSEFNRINLNDVAEVTRIGNGAGTGLLIGGAGGILLGLLGAGLFEAFADVSTSILTLGNETHDSDNGAVAIAVIFSTAAGAGIGALIGSAIPRFKTYYKKCA